MNIFYKRKNAFVLGFLALTMSIASCVSQKEITYFQSNPVLGDSLEMAINQKYSVKIQSGDILGIYVSSLSPEASAMFNPYLAAQSTTPINQSTSSNAPVAATGFLVDDEGNIILPLVGKINLLGETTISATNLLTKKLDTYLEHPTVNVRILNFKVSVMGEVVRPSVYTVPNEKITLPEALSLAGDLTIYGRRDNILVIRQIDGKKEFKKIDLTKRDIFNSSYYYLHPNDIVYVEPSRGRTTSTDRTVQLAPIFISAITLITVLLTNIL